MEAKKETKDVRNHVIFKIVLAIIIIFTLLLIVHLVRNYTILTNIARMELELSKHTNYSYVSEAYSSNSDKPTTSTEFYVKDNREYASDT